MRFEGSLMAAQTPPERRNKIMHTRMTVDDKMLMGTDALPDLYERMKGFSVTISVDDPDRADFAYLDKIIDAENRVTAIAGVFNGHFEIPNNPATPPFPGISFLNDLPISDFTRRCSTSGKTKRASSASCPICTPGRT